MNKVLHRPVIRLKEAAEVDDGMGYVAALSYLFDLPLIPDDESTHKETVEGVHT